MEFPLIPDLGTLLWQILNFVLLLVVLNVLVFRPLRTRLNERGRTLSDKLQTAQDEEAEATRLREEWERRRNQAERQAEEIIRAAEVDAERRAAEIISDARQRLDEITEEIRNDVLRQRNEILARHYDELLDSMIALSANVVQAVTTRRTHDDLVNNFCANIYQMPQEQVDEIREAMSDRVPSAHIRTPVELSEEQTKTVEDTLSSLIDRRVELHVTVDRALIAGIQARLADHLIDNSLRQQLLDIRKRVQDSLIEEMGDQAQS